MTPEAKNPCRSRQTETAAEDLRSSGYDVEVETIPGATHWAPIFHDESNGEWVAVPEDPVGQQTVETIIDAIEATHP